MMVGVASRVEMRTHHIQIWPPSCRSTPLERPDRVYSVDNFYSLGGGGGGAPIV